MSVAVRGPGEPRRPTPPSQADRKDLDEPGPGDRETLDQAERAIFEDDAMRERDA